MRGKAEFDCEHVKLYEGKRILGATTFFYNKQKTLYKYRRYTDDVLQFGTEVKPYVAKEPLWPAVRACANA